MTLTEQDRGGAGGGRGGPASRTKGHKESLEEVLRRRSGPSAGEGAERAAAVEFSLRALTRNAEGAMRDVPLEELHANPFQPRFQFQRQPLEELAASLASEGQLEPAIARRVRRDGVDVLEVVAGARRLEAAKICNATMRPFPTLRVDVRELSDEEAERISLIENLQRENLTPLEEGYRYWQLQQRDPRRWSVRAIADFVHKKKSSVQNRLGLVKDAAVAEAVLREELPPTAGFHILRLPAPEREGYLRSAVAQRRTVEQIKSDVERRLLPRHAPRQVDIGRGATGAISSDQGEDEADGGWPETMVGTHVRRLPRVGRAPDAARRTALEAERTRLLARIEGLESELHRCQTELRGVERELRVSPEGEWRAKPPEKNSSLS